MYAEQAEMFALFLTGLTKHWRMLFTNLFQVYKKVMMNLSPFKTDLNMAILYEEILDFQ